MNWVDSFYLIQLGGYCMEKIMKGDFNRVIDTLNGKNEIYAR